MLAGAKHAGGGAAYCVADWINDLSRVLCASAVTAPVVAVLSTARCKFDQATYIVTCTWARLAAKQTVRISVTGVKPGAVINTAVVTFKGGQASSMADITINVSANHGHVVIVAAGGMRAVQCMHAIQAPSDPGKGQSIAFPEELLSTFEQSASNVSAA